MTKFLTAEERTNHKLELFRLAAQLVHTDEHLAALAAEDLSSYAPPDPYSKAIAAHRAAEAPAAPAESFEDRYKAQRRAEFAAEYERGRR